jgi:hypothetical protein
LRQGFGIRPARPFSEGGDGSAVLGARRSVRAAVPSANGALGVAASCNGGRKIGARAIGALQSRFRPDSAACAAREGQKGSTRWRFRLQTTHGNAGEAGGGCRCETEKEPVSDDPSKARRLIRKGRAIGRTNERTNDESMLGCSNLLHQNVSFKKFLARSICVRSLQEGVLDPAVRSVVPCFSLASPIPLEDFFSRQPPIRNEAPRRIEPQRANKEIGHGVSSRSKEIDQLNKKRIPRHYKAHRRSVCCEAPAPACLSHHAAGRSLSPRDQETGTD